jgi:hypothetical protein
VRSVLSAAIAERAPPKPTFANIEERLAHLRWLGAMSEKLHRQKAELSTGSNSSTPSGTRACAPGWSRR